MKIKINKTPLLILIGFIIGHTISHYLFQQNLKETVGDVFMQYGGFLVGYYIHKLK